MALQLQTAWLRLHLADLSDLLNFTTAANRLCGPETEAGLPTDRLRIRLLQNMGFPRSLNQGS